MVQAAQFCQLIMELDGLPALMIGSLIHNVYVWPYKVTDLS